MSRTPAQRKVWRETSKAPSNSATYRTWVKLRERCDRKADRYYHRYGGRGIRYCSRWKSFANFVADMGIRPEGMTLDRIDHDGDYTPENCRWATMTEQQRNRCSNKLTPAAAASIKERLAAGELASSLANEHHVSTALVYQIKYGQKWKTPEPRSSH